jgi:hypothetical protein
MALVAIMRAQEDLERHGPGPSGCRRSGCFWPARQRFVLQPRHPRARPCTTGARTLRGARGRVRGGGPSGGRARVRCAYVSTPPERSRAFLSGEPAAPSAAPRTRTGSRGSASRWGEATAGVEPAMAVLQPAARCLLIPLGKRHSGPLRPGCATVRATVRDHRSLSGPSPDRQGACPLSRVHAGTAVASAGRGGRRRPR